MVNRIISTLLLSAILVLGWSMLPPSAASQDPGGEVRNLLESRDLEIKRVLGDSESFTDAQRAQLKKVVNEGIDFEAMGKTALGPFWAQITPSQRTEYVDVFGEIVRSQSLSNLDVYRSKVTYDDIEVVGDSAHVVTTTVYEGVPTKVAYVMGKKEGEWRVRDIVLDDVSTAQGYARSFQTVIRKKGFEALMESLRKKLDEVNS